MKHPLCTLAFLAVSCLCRAQDIRPVNAVPSEEGLFPFVFSYEMARGVTDFSGLLDAPAGKYGFTRVEGQHFVNDKGRIRFNGVNLVGGANFPSHKQAERLAKRLAHFGFNLVRLHFFDLVNYHCRDFQEKGLLVDDGTDCTFDPVQLDLFDYLIAQLKKQGIYLNVNLLVGRESFKSRNGYDKEIQQKELDFARNLFTHVNPYTGLTLAEDPAVAMVELNNENAAIRTYFEKTTWDPDRGEPAWPSLSELWKQGPEKRLEMLETLEAADRNHWKIQRDLLVNELGVKVPVTSTQADYTNLWALQDMDYVDMHGYWCYPQNSGNIPEWIIKNLPMVNDPFGGKLSDLTCYRPADRPYTVSEYNHPFPNFYGTEAQPMLRAFGAFQGWDALIAHSYNNRADEEPDGMPYNFTFASRTDALAHFIACATMYLREDVKESQDQWVQHLPRPFYEADWKKRLVPQISDMLIKAGDSTFLKGQRVVHRVATDIHAAETKAFPKETLGPVLTTDGGQIEWNRDIPDRGMFIVRTDNTKLFSGFPAGRTVDWGDGIRFTVGETKLGWTTMSLVSKKANGFAHRSKAILAATGYTKLTGQKYVYEPDPKDPSQPSVFLHCKNVEWGTGPMLTEGIQATVKLASKARQTRCWALDERGARMKRVPVKKAEDGCALLEIGPEYKTVWYEIKSR